MTQDKKDLTKNKVMQGIPQEKTVKPRDITNTLVRSPDFEKIYVTKAIPFMTDFDLRILLTNEVVKTDTSWCTVADQMIILTPVAAKELMNELGACISAYEEIQGKIKPRLKNRIITRFERGEG